MEWSGVIAVSSQSMDSFLTASLITFLVSSQVFLPLLLPFLSFLWSLLPDGVGSRCSFVPFIVLPNYHHIIPSKYDAVRSITPAGRLMILRALLIRSDRVRLRILHRRPCVIWCCKRVSPCIEIVAPGGGSSSKTQLHKSRVR